MRILINIFAGLLLIGSLTVSCNGCERKTTEITTTQEGTMADSLSASGNGDDNYQNGSNGSGSNGSGTSGRDNSGNDTRTASGSKDGKATSSSKKSGYSAANGTDAENHDGDPYTKHDTTSMPTGTSIR